MLMAVSLKAMAAVLKPSSRSRWMPGCGHSDTPLPMRVHGIWKTVPILTRTARRYSGSPQVGVTSTASMFSAAAERKMAPMLVESTMPSRTATRRALAHTASTLGRGGRRMAHSTPRVSW